MKNVKTSIIVPVYNEEATIDKVLRRIQSVSGRKEIVVVDDGSDDRTTDVLRSLSCAPNIRVFYHYENKGKGAAVRTGLRRACGDVVLIQDADLELDPSCYPSLVRPIVEDEADIVYGSRFTYGNVKGLPWYRYWGNRFLNYLANVICGSDFTDLQTCYKVFRREIAEEIELKSDGFAFDPEFTARIAKADYRICEVPVSYNPRERDDGRKYCWKDAVISLPALVWFGLAA